MHRSPWLHFIAIGLLLYVLPGPWNSSLPLVPPRIEAEQVRAAAADWLRRTGSYPSSAQIESLVWDDIDQELLLREGLRLGLHLSDPLIWRRLVRNMRFLGMQGEDWKLLRQALELGMQHRDAVVRRRVIQMMEERHRHRIVPPSEEELRARYKARQGDYQRVRVAFSQIFFARQGRGAEAAWQAAAALRRSCRSALFDSEHGEPFPAGVYQPLQTVQQIAKNFGGHFADEIIAGEEGACLGPVASAYGAHLVYIQQRREELIPYAALRERLREELLRELVAHSLREELQALRKNYGVDAAQVLAVLREVQR